MEQSPTHDNADATSPDRRSWLWPAIVIGFLAIHASVWLGFASIAVTDPHFSVEPDHYRKSLAWDKTAAAMRSSSELGWTVQLETDLQTSTPGQRRVACRISDREGDALENATVQLEAFPHARGNERLHATLRSEGNGKYAATIPMRRSGLWEFRLKVSRDKEIFSQIVLHEVPAEEGETVWQH